MGADVRQLGGQEDQGEGHGFEHDHSTDEWCMIGFSPDASRDCFLRILLLRTVPVIMLSV